MYNGFIRFYQIGRLLEKIFSKWNEIIEVKDGWRTICGTS